MSVRPQNYWIKPFLAALVLACQWHVLLAGSDELERLLQKGDKDDLFEFIEELGSDFQKSHALDAAIQKLKLEPDDLVRMVELVRDMDSDHYRHMTLKKILERAEGNPDIQRVVVKAAGKLSSNHHISQVLMVVLDQTQHFRVFKEVVEVAEDDLESDYHRAQILIQVIRRMPGSDLMRTDFLDALEEIKSDSHYVEVVVPVFEKKDISQEDLNRLVEHAAENLESDAYLSRVVSMANLRVSTREILRVTRRLSSDHQRGEMLIEVLQRDDVKHSVREVLECAESLHSDHQKGIVLRQALKTISLEALLSEGFLDVLHEVHSESESRSIIAQMVSNAHLTEGQKQRIVETAMMHLNSDHARSQVLMVFAEQGLTDRQFFRALSRLESEHMKGRVIEKLLRKKSLKEEGLVALLETVGEMDGDHVKFKALETFVSMYAVTPELEFHFENALESLDKSYYKTKLRQIARH